MIIDKINIILLKLLIIVNIELNQAKTKSNNNTVVLDGLAIMILIEDFYQFSSIVGIAF